MNTRPLEQLGAGSNEGSGLSPEAMRVNAVEAAVGRLIIAEQQQFAAESVS